MAKIKKNYYVNDSCVDLLCEVANQLGMKQGEALELLITNYSLSLYDDILKARLENFEVMERLEQLRGLCEYEICNEEEVAV